jgi:hypothetical protein
MLGFEYQICAGRSGEVTHCVSELLFDVLCVRGGDAVKRECGSLPSVSKTMDQWAALILVACTLPAHECRLLNVSNWNSGGAKGQYFE